MNFYTPLPAAQPTLGRVSNLPPRNPSFTGREAVLTEIDRRLHSTDAGRVVGVVPLQGMGGIGKTQLALEYAHLHQREYGVVWWVNAENLAVATAELVALAGQLGIAVSAGADTVPPGLWSALEGRGDWLLVYDNVDDLAVLAQLRPPSSGSLLVTGRSAVLGRLGDLVEIAEFSRPESIGLLRRRCPSLPDAEAGLIAAELGDLPLAIEQAGCFLADTGMDSADYRDVLAGQPADAGLSDPTLDRHPGLVNVFSASRARLGETAPQAASLLDQMAFLAPEPLPLRTTARPVGVRIGAPLVAAAIVRDLTRLGLARHAEHTLTVHRLVQALARALLPAPDHPAVLLAAQQLLATAAPDDPTDPACWPGLALLTPHVEAVSQHLDTAADPANAEEPEFRALLVATARYLVQAGQEQAARELADAGRRRWSAALGADHPDTLTATAVLARAQRGLGQDAAAYDLIADTLDRRRRVLGPDHPETLAAATELAFVVYRMGDAQRARELAEQIVARQPALGADHPAILMGAVCLAIALSGIGQHAAARDLDADTLDRRRRVLGPDHPDTLQTAHNLAIGQRNLGEHAAASELDADTLDRRRRVLGPDHPSTLWSAHNLAIGLSNLGAHAAARDLHTDTLDRRRRVLGPDHPDTLWSAHNLAVDLTNLGEHAAASELDADTLDRRRRVLGPDHPDTLWSAQNLAVLLRNLGEHAAARDLDADTLDRRRGLLGPDDPDTLWSAHCLAVDLSNLGDDAAARDLDADTLDRRRRVLGPDDPDTLCSAHNLATGLSNLGDDAAARDLDADTLDRRRRVLGPDHPDTLCSAHNLAVDLGNLDEQDAARDLAADTLDRRYRVLGPDHADTLASAGLAESLAG